MIGDLYKHLKTGNLYEVKDVVNNCNNNRISPYTIIYARVTNPDFLFSRDESEFKAKFEKVTDDNQSEPTE